MSSNNINIAFYSPKGGSGVSAVAAAVALQFARIHRTVLVDHGDDAVPTLGVGGSTPDVFVGVGDNLHVGSAMAWRVNQWGTPPTVTIHDMAEHHLAVQNPSGARRILVVRPCYLSLRRVMGGSSRFSKADADGVVLVSEPGRALGKRDVENCLGVPVLAEVPYDPAVARAIDAGLLSARMPKSLNDALQPLIDLALCEAMV